jgi:mono/diheme cytochrome c family protein
VRRDVAVAGIIFLLASCGERARQEPAATASSDPAAATAIPADTATAAPATPPAAAPATPPAAGPAPAADAPLKDAYHTAPRDTISREAYNGWKQFELNCARCHGEYAVGTSFAPALVVSLREGGTVPTREAFVTTVCQGRKEKGMPSWCELGLEMDKIMGIYAYVKGRADGKIHEGRPAVQENS